MFPKLIAGDFFGATCASRTHLDGISMICIVHEIDKNYIKSRRITTQDYHKFDVSSGLEVTQRTNKCTIVSCAPLSSNLFAMALEIDRKYRFANEDEDYKLTKSQIDALVNISQFYEENRLKD